MSLPIKDDVFLLSRRARVKISVPFSGRGPWFFSACISSVNDVLSAVETSLSSKYRLLMLSHFQRLLYAESYHRIQWWQTLVAFQPKIYPTFLLRHCPGWTTPETLCLHFLGAVVKLEEISGCKAKKGLTSMSECPINNTTGPLIVINYLIVAPIKTLSSVSSSRFTAGKVVTFQSSFLNKKQLSDKAIK